MIEPGYALQELIGDHLATVPAVTAHVAPINIRSGTARPENLPCVILSPARVAFLGHAAGGQMVAEVRVILNIWAVEDGSAKAEAIAGAVMMALMDAPKATDFEIDEWDRPALTWSRDPDPAQVRTHGILGLRAVLRWKVS